MEKEKVIYYSDELNDEFSAGGITAKVIDKSYKYEGTPLRPLARGFFYHFLAKILAVVYLDLVFGHRIVGKRKFKMAKGGIFLYGNHTNPVPDALIPTKINLLGSTYVIVHPDNVSMPVLGDITPSLGAIPLPDDKDAFKHYLKYMSRINSAGKTIAVYPEAHIWPYYTKIRPFKADSFHYPVMYNAPVFCFTNTYQKRLFFKTPRIVTYIDGPFYKNDDLPKKEQIKDLRDRVYAAMVRDAKHSNVEIIKYIKKESVSEE